MRWEKSPEFGRRMTLIDTLNRLEKKKNHQQVIVEIGTSEAYSPLGIGNAVLAFGYYASLLDARVHSVDIREGAIRNSRAILEEHYSPGVERVIYHNLDAFEWAALSANWEHFSYLPHIDLIYYDGPSEPASWYVELHSRLENRFPFGALALFDDTDPRHDYAGKGSALIPKLLSEGWTEVQVAGEPVFPMVLLEKITT